MTEATVLLRSMAILLMKTGRTSDPRSSPARHVHLLLADVHLDRRSE
jgi:hypothetical protein